MKKIFAFILVVGALFAANVTASAQAGTVNYLKSQYSNNTDTVVNTATKYMRVAAAAPIGGYQKAITFAVTLTEISDTTGGTLTLEASLDGTNWYNAYESRDSAYTFTPADVASQTFNFRLTDIRDRWYRVKYVGSGTMSTIIAGRYLY